MKCRLSIFTASKNNEFLIFQQQKSYKEIFKGSKQMSQHLILTRVTLTIKLLH